MMKFVVRSFMVLALFVAYASAFLPAPALFARSGSCARASSPALGGLKMVDITVVVNDGEPIESALRRFKNAVSKSGHLLELKRRRTFETNKEKEIRREKEAGRKRRMLKVKNSAPADMGPNMQQKPGFNKSF